MDSTYLTLSRYIQPTLIVLGTIGALLNLALFHCRKSLRTNSCALYFRALSINDLCVLCYVTLSQWLEYQFGVGASAHYNWYCKLSNYLTYTLYTLSPYFVVLACFDRLCTSSTHAKLRRVATMRVAFIQILAVIALICLSQIYLLVGSTIASLPFGSMCVLAGVVHNRMLSYTIAFLFCLIPPSLMITFCGITFMLLRRQRSRIMPVNLARSRHRNNQILKMLGIYVIWNIVCLGPFAVTYFIQMSNSNNAAPQSKPLVLIFGLLLCCNYASSFYIYTLGTPFYREELYKFIRKWLRHLHLFNQRHKHEHRERDTH